MVHKQHHWVENFPPICEDGNFHPNDLVEWTTNHIYHKSWNGPDTRVEITTIYCAFHASVERSTFHHLSTFRVNSLWFVTFCVILNCKMAVCCIIICPIAIAYSYGTDNKIGLRLSVCVSVCLSVCLSVRVSSLSRSHFFVDFHQIWHRGVNPQK